MTIQEHAASLKHGEIVSLLQSNQSLTQKVSQLEQQLNWFKTQLFGQKSEKRFADSDPRQIALGELLEGETAEPAKQTVAAHARRKFPQKVEEETTAPLIDPSLPLREITILPPE